MTDSTNLSAEAAVDAAPTDDLNSAADMPASEGASGAERLQLAQAVVDVPMPNPGETVTITVAAGQTIRLGFDYAAAGNGEVLENGSLVLPVNGGQVILVGFAGAATFDPPVELTNSDGTVIELGDFLVAIDVPLDVLVEAAAGGGEPGGPLPETVAPNEGAGFSPGPGPVILGVLDPEGPVDPTALQYRVPEREPFIIDIEGEGGGDVPDAVDDFPSSEGEEICLTEDTQFVEGEGYDFEEVFVVQNVSGNVLTDVPGADSFGADGPGGIIDLQYIGGIGDAGAPDTSVPGQVTITALDGSWTLVLFTADGVGVDAGDYTFTLFGPVDHPAQGIDEIDGLFQYTIEDADGDTDSATLSICIIDDVPTVELGGAEGSLTLDESLGHGFNPADPNDSDEDASSEDDIGYAQLSVFSLFPSLFSSIDGGADGLDSVSFGLSLPTPGADSGLVDTETGTLVLLSLDGGDIVGLNGNGDEVLRITVDTDTGLIEVHQFRAVEHDDPADDDENGPGEPETIDPNLVLVQVTVTDGDGDTTTDSADLGSLILFEDDGPVVAAAATESTVSEVGLPNVVTGDIGIDFGSDEAGDVTDITGPAGIFSGGVEITYSFDPDTNTLTGSTGGPAIFTVSIDPETGQYSFTLIGQLDHGGSSNLALNFDFTATDGDGDPVDSSFIVNVTDGVAPPTAALTINGAGFFKEDVTNSVHIAAAVGDPTDELTTVEIQGLTWGVSGAELAELIALPDVADATFVAGTLTITFVAGVETFAHDLDLTPPEDTDVDLSGVTITANVADQADGSVTASFTAAPVTLVVDAVLDQFADGSQTAAPSVVESAAVQTVDLNLSLTLTGAGFANSGAGLADTDGSEVVTSVTITLSGGTLVLDGYAGTAVLTDNGGGNYTLTGWTDFADLQDAIDALSAQLPAGFDGSITGTLSVTTTEANTPQGTVPASGAEPDITDNTRTDTTNFSATITPGVEPPTAAVTVNGAGFFKEDVTNSVHIAAAVEDATDQLTTVEIQGLTWGVSGAELAELIALPDVANATFVAGTLTITFEPGVETFTHNLDLTPPEDTDVDLSGVTITANVSDKVNVSATDSFTAAPVTLVVDAVLDDFADGSQTAVPSVVESVVAQTVDLNLSLTLTGAGFPNSGAGGADTDLSEVVTSVTVTLSGGTLALDPGYAGTAVVTDNGGGNYTLSGWTDFADLQDAVNALSAHLPAGFDNGTITGQLSVTTREANTPAGTVPASGAEPDVADNTRTDTTDFTVNVTDDGPEPTDDAATVGDAGNTETNLVIVFDRSGSMDEDPGVDGFATRIDLARAAVAALMNSYNTFGPVNIMIVDFAGAPSTGGVANNSGWLTGEDAVLQAIDYLAGLQPDGTTDYSEAIDEVQDAYAGAPAGADQQFVYFISDGNPTVGGDAVTHELTGPQIAAWESFLTTNNFDTAFAVGVGAGVTNINALEGVAFPNIDGDDNPIIVTDEEELLTTLVETVGGTVSDNVLTNDTDFGADGPPAGGAYVTSITFGATTWTYDKTLDQFTDGITTTPGHEIDITGDHGSLHFNFLTGAYTYEADDVTQVETDPFSYTVVDDDGTEGSANLIVTVNDVDISVIARDDRIITNIANGSDILIPAAALLFNDFGFDGGTLSIDSVQNAVNGSVLLGGGGVTFNASSNSASFDYTATVGAGSEDDATVTVTTVAGATITSAGDDRDILIGGGGNDTLIANAGGDVLIGGAGDDELNGGSGADLLFGGAGADELNGGAAGDYLDGGDDGGAVDTLNGGAGDDILVVWINDIANGGNDSDIIILKDNVNFGSVDGGLAELSIGGMTNHRGDMLVFNDALDLTVIDNSRVQGIETVSMREGDGSTGDITDVLTLNADDVISMGTGEFDPEGQFDPAGALNFLNLTNQAVIRVDGDDGDTLNLEGGGWVLVEPGHGQPAGYNLWVHDSGVNGPTGTDLEDAYVLVQAAVAVNAS